MRALLNMLHTSLLLISAAIPHSLAAQIALPVPETDTAFHALVGKLARDSLWPRDQQAPARYYVVTTESIALLRRTGVASDSTYAARYIGCRDNPATAPLSGDAVHGYVLSASVGAGMDSSALAIHFTVGCRIGTGAAVRTVGHYCAWDVVRDGPRWRVLRSRRCWVLDQ